eukprot:10466489-Heterocapsa_arctica.AAC.1
MAGISAGRSVKPLDDITGEELEKLVDSMIWTPTYQGPTGETPGPRVESAPAADLATRVPKRPYDPMEHPANRRAAA